MALSLASSRLRRRALLGATPVVIAGLLLAGCGRSSDTAASSDVTIDDSPATGTIDLWAGAPDADSLADFLKPFEDANPDVTINVRSIPSDEYDTTLTAAIASGNVPDVAMLYSQTEAAMLATDAFSPVPDGAVDESSFFDSSWASGVVDGTAYAVPWYSYANVLYYRSDILDELGLEVPTTWDEMTEVAEALVAAGYTNPIATDVGYDGYTAQAFNDFLGQAGGSFLSDDQTEWTIDTPEALDALTYWASMFSDGLASADGPAFLDRTPNMISGASVMMINGPWFPGWLNEAAGDGWTDTHLAAAIAPAGPAGVSTSLGGGSFGVMQDADNADAAWKLIRYISEPEVQTDWYSTFGNLPAVSAAWDEDPIASDPLLASVKDSIPDARLVPTVPGWGEVGAMIGQQLETVARGQATPAEALATMQSQADAIGTGVE